VIFLLESALLVALAATAAFWTWQIFAPRSIGPSAHVDSASPASEGAATRHLFGAAGAAATDLGAASRLRLIGVASLASSGTGRAVFVVDNGKSRAARTGESIVPGTVLREVHPDHVILERGGAMERLRLERRNGAR
jgi:general secretion pathway protein C